MHDLSEERMLPRFRFGQGENEYENEERERVPERGETRNMGGKPMPRFRITGWKPRATAGDRSRSLTRSRSRSLLFCFFVSGL